MYKNIKTISWWEEVWLKLRYPVKTEIEDSEFLLTTVKYIEDSKGCIYVLDSKTEVNG